MCMRYEFCVAGWRHYLSCYAKQVMIECKVCTVDFYDANPIISYELLLVNICLHALA